MLFNSYEFILGFFPITVVGFFLIAAYNNKAAAVWLVMASLFFYGWWSITAVPLLLLSIFTNYIFGLIIAPRSEGKKALSEQIRKIYLCIAITVNLTLLGFFKYSNFFITNVNTLLGVLQKPEISLLNIVLPVGVSFYTFTQIAFLVDCWQGKVKSHNFIHYMLFVSYFPHLIAGPILHHAQIIPQFSKQQTYKPNLDHIASGIAIFAVGLGKKLLIADPLSEVADALFQPVASGVSPTFYSSWLGVLAFTFQIYFDFSGYSDMAIGLSLFFNIYLPINFNSPYKATSIIDFWRRWHISLSTFLRDYLYIPLGGNRKGKMRRYLNLLITMLLGGLWHGASWMYVLWGLAHGSLLIINNFWRSVVGEKQYSKLGQTICWAVTFLSICCTWVLFKAENIKVAHQIYRGMFGLNGNGTDNMQLFPTAAVGIAFLLAISNKNSQKIALGIENSKMSYFNYKNLSLTPTFAVCIGMLLFICLLKIDVRSPFLYFQF